MDSADPLNPDSQREGTLTLKQGMYECATIMGGFVIKFAPKMGASFSILAGLYYQYHFEDTIYDPHGYFFLNDSIFYPLWMRFIQSLHL